MKLSEKLTKLRKAKGLTQHEIAEALGVSRQAVSRWEVGTATPTLDNLSFLSRMYSVPLDYFIQEEVGAEIPETVPVNTPPAAPTKADRPHTIPVCLFLGVLVLVLGIGILIGASLRQKSENPVYVYKFDPEIITIDRNDPTALRGWFEVEEIPSPPENDTLEILSPYKVIATYDPALGLLEMMPNNIPEEIKKDFERRISK